MKRSLRLIGAGIAVALLALEMFTAVVASAHGGGLGQDVGLARATTAPWTATAETER